MVNISIDVFKVYYSKQTLPLILLKILTLTLSTPISLFLALFEAVLEGFFHVFPCLPLCSQSIQNINGNFCQKRAQCVLIHLIHQIWYYSWLFSKVTTTTRLTFWLDSGHRGSRSSTSQNSHERGFLSAASDNDKSNELSVSDVRGLMSVELMLKYLLL